MIAEGLKGNCTVKWVDLVSAGLFLVRLLLLTCVEQRGNEDMSDAVKRQFTQVLQEGHGADKGVAITAGSYCHFFDFETCEKINLVYSKFANGSYVRLLSLHDAA